jgi:hypothetical protein
MRGNQFFQADSETLRHLDVDDPNAVIGAHIRNAHSLRSVPLTPDRHLILSSSQHSEDRRSSLRDYFGEASRDPATSMAESNAIDMPIKS